MNRRYLCSVLLSALFAAGCSKANETTNKNEQLNATCSLTVTLSTETNNDTDSAKSRAALTEDSENEVWETTWSSGDQIFCYEYAQGDFNLMSMVGEPSADGKNAIFESDDFEYSTENDNVRFFYPTTIENGDGMLHLDFTNQSYDAATESPYEWVAKNNMYLMSNYISISELTAGDNIPTLKHLGSIVKFVIIPTGLDTDKSHTVKSVEIRCNGMYGLYSVKNTAQLEADNIYSAPNKGSQSPYVKISNGEISNGSQFEFYVAMPPFTITAGEYITLVMTMNDGTEDYECILTEQNSSGTDILFDKALHHDITFADAEFTKSTTLSGSGYENDPYIVNSKGTLAILAESVNNNEATYSSAYIQLTANINLDGSADDQWSPIGSSSSISFKGTFDGGGHTISGLYIDSSIERQGLFGYCSGATIKSLNVEGEIKGSAQYAGLISGYVSSSTIYNCGSSGSVYSSYSSKSYFGGLVGYLKSSDLYNCYNHATIEGSSSSNVYVGGVAAYTTSTQLIQNCYNIGSVSNGGYGYINPIAYYNYNTNNYYLDGVCAIYNPNIDKSVSRSETQMKSSDFVDELNDGAAELDDCCKWIIEGDGEYPTLDYEEE